MEVTGTVATLLDGKGRKVYWTSPDTMVFEAIKELATRDIGALLVMESGRLIGVFSERDYTRKIVLLGRTSRDTKVREVITGRLVTVPSTSNIPECMRLMIDNRIRHLPVVDEDQVIGVVSIGDLVNFIINAQRATIEQLHSYIAGGYPG